MKREFCEKDGRLPITKTRLKELQGDMSVTDFAKKIGLSRQTVGFYLNGDRIPDSETLAQICQNCHVSADWLLGLSEEKTMDSSTQNASLYTGLQGELAAAGNAVTIDTEEYRRLVEQNAYLNMILAAANDPKSYILSDITGLVDGLMKSSMAVTEGVGAQNAPPAVESNNEETTHGEANHAE